MKEYDDTQIENEMTIEHLWNWCKATEKEMALEIADLKKRLANLETQRTPQDENDDPEWYS